MLKALYILKFSSYICSFVVLASSSPFSFRYILSSSLINPSFLLLLGNFPSLSPIIKTIFLSPLLLLSTSPTITSSKVAGIFPKEELLSPVFNSSM